jgi:uncharacterized protein (UPF0548 family)
MRLLTASKAREAAFDCEGWSTLPANASREAAHGEGYLHDSYESPFTGDFERAAEALLLYEIFAPGRMYRRVCTSDGRVAVGATIIQRVVLGPASIETAVRVIEVECTEDRASFAYATLQGHPERGVASFAVTRAHGPHRFEAQAWSRAGNLLTTLGRPVSRALQRGLTREAVASFCSLNSAP